MSASKSSSTPMSEIIEMMKKMLDEKVEQFSTQEDLKKSRTTIEAKLEQFATAVFDIVKENRALKEKIRILEEGKKEDAKVLSRLEDHIKRKNIVVRGVTKSANLAEAVENFAMDGLKMLRPLDYQGARKLKENGEKMDILIELKSENVKHEIYAHVHNLRGKRILVEDDLNGERLQDKKVLLQLRKDIMAFNNEHFVAVRSDRLIVGNRFLKWNKDKQLMCGSQPGLEYMESVYGYDGTLFDLDYDSLLKVVNTEKKIV